MAKSFLLTQCLQKDFTGPIGPQDPLPNLLHIGSDESRRLLGENPAEGPVARFMSWASGMNDERLSLIHIRDWHDAKDPAQAEHLKHFGMHCLAGTPGADFVFPSGGSKKIPVVNSPGLNDFLGTDLAELLDSAKESNTRIGIIGVWTEAKVGFLAYELRTRFPQAEIAVCSALTASSSRTQHFLALEQLSRILEIRIIHTVGAFADFLAGQNIAVETVHFDKSVKLETPDTLSDEDEKVVRYLFRHSASVEVRRLDGGFSGNTVLGAQSVDVRGLLEAAHVVKIGPREPMGQERVAFETVEDVLGNHAPRIADFVEIGSRGGIKYRYASMGGNAKSSTFQKRYTSGASLETIRRLLDAVFADQLGKFTRAAHSERARLLDYYAFAPKWGAGVRKSVDGLKVPVLNDELAVTPKHAVRHPAFFYEEVLAGMSTRAPDRVPFTTVHGDLNGANIIIDGNENVWLIDFFHTHHGHALRDLIKLENDVLYIFTPLENEAELEEACRFSDLLLEIEDLAGELKPASATGLTAPSLLRAWETVRMLRSYYAPIVKTDRDPFQWQVAHLRYAMHTLSFDESSLLQKKWALYTGARCAEQIAETDRLSQGLRIDMIEDARLPKEKLGITILPGRKDRNRDLDKDLAALRSSGVTHIGVFLTAEEMSQYGVPNLIEAYKGAGFEIRHLPILDQRIPAKSEMENCVRWIEAALDHSGKVVLHCVGGLGRSGLAAACFLKLKGLTADAALAVVRRSRSARAVENNLQEEFLRSF